MDTSTTTKTTTKTTTTKEEEDYLKTLDDSQKQTYEIAYRQLRINIKDTIGFKDFQKQKMFMEEKEKDKDLKTSNGATKH
jgi:hypothetical protein